MSGGGGAAADPLPPHRLHSRVVLRELCPDRAHVGSVNVWEVPGYRLEVTPFGGVKDSGTGVKEGVQECCKAFTNVKTYSLPW